MDFPLTILFIVLATVVAAFIRRISRDKCLKDFWHDRIALEKTDGNLIEGELNVENTGLEFIYPAKTTAAQTHNETTCILYKKEYSEIQALIRYHDQLTKAGKIQREDELNKTYHPALPRRLKRKIQNIFKTVRDSVMEVVNMLIGKAKKATPAGAVLTSQEKYVSKMKQDLVGMAGTSFEPLLEKYIGHKVVLELLKGDKIFEYCGVLKEYTADFIEIMDVSYKSKEDEPARTADLIVPRKYGIVRHLGE